MAQLDTQENRKDLTYGNLWKKMFLFCIPLIITNLLQSVYSIVDMIVVGQFMGSAGLSAVSIGGQVTAVVLCLVMGISSGGSVMIAQMSGAGCRDKIGRTISTMTGFFLISAVILTILIIIFAKPLLTLIHTPAEAFEYACSYLRICMLGTIFIYLFNMLTASLRGLGESTIPMILVGASSVLNIILDLWFVGGLGLQSDGAAWATMLSQFFSFIVLFLLIKKKNLLPFWADHRLKIYREEFRILMKVGIPQAGDFVITNLSFLFLSGMINTYGVHASAAAGAAAKLGNFAIISAQAAFTAIITLTGQNIGAKQYKRALQGMGMGLIYSVPLALAFYLLSYFLPEQILGLFTTEAEVLAVGVPYLQVVAISFIVESVLFCLLGIMVGAGYSNISFLCTVIDAVAVRIVFAKVLSTVAGLGFMGIAWAYPCAPAVSLVICFFFILSGKWKISRLGV